VLDEPLVVPGVTAGVHDPGERPLDDPAARQNDEAGSVRWPADGLEGEVEVLVRPGHELSGIAGMSAQTMVISGCISRSRNRTSFAALPYW